MSYEEIGKKLGKSLTSVYSRRGRLKLNQKSVILAGSKFGRLTVISESEFRTKSNKRMYVCSCECGAFKNVPGNKLQCGDTKSCGCLYKDTVGISTRHLPGEVSWNEHERRYRSNATQRGFIYSLTKEEFRKITSSNCFYCGSEPVRYNKFFKKDGVRIKSNFSTSDEWAEKQWISINGIDRKNSLLGYTLENCVPCCSVCNTIKMDLSIEEFLEKCKKITDFQSNK